MKYERFEQLPVWQAAIDLAAAVYALTDGPAFKGRYSLRDQIERAAVSVSNNIAEGFERGTSQELLTFLYIARGSAGEVRSMLCLLDKMRSQRLLNPTGQASDRQAPGGEASDGRTSDGQASDGRSSGRRDSGRQASANGSSLESDILNLKSRAESISRQLGAWLRTLKDSGLKGERYVTEKTRRADKAARDRAEFLRELEQIRTGGKPPGSSS